MLTLRRLSIASLALVAIAAAIVVWRAPAWSVDLIARRLGAALGREVTVGSVRYALFPFRAEVRGLRVAGPEPSDPPFLEVPLIVAAPSLRPLWEQRLDLYELRVVGPQIRVRAFTEGGDDIPKLRLGGRRAAAEFRIRRLLIEGGELWVNHERVPLDLDLPSFEGRLARARPGSSAGASPLAPATRASARRRPCSLSTTMDVAFRDGIFSIESARLHGPRTDLVYRGQLHLVPRLRADLELSGALDLGIVDRHVLVTDFGLEGAAHFQGWARLEGSRVRLGGRLSGTDGKFDGIDVPRYTGDVGWDAQGVHLRKFAATFLDGTGVFDVDVPPAPSEVTLRATLSGVDAERLAAYVFDLGLARARSGGDRRRRAPLAARAHPRVDRHPGPGPGAERRRPHAAGRPRRVARPRGNAVRRRGHAADAGDRGASPGPHRGGRRRRSRGGCVEHRPAVERRPGGAGTAGAARGGRGAGRVERQRAVPGKVAGHARGADLPGALQRAAGGLPGRVVGPRGMDGRRGAGAPAHGAARGAARRRRAPARGMDGHRAARGADALDLRVVLSGWPAADLTRALAWDVDLQGPVTGDATLRGRRSAPVGVARFTSPRGKFSGVGYEALQRARRRCGNRPPR